MKVAIQFLVNMNVVFIVDNSTTLLAHLYHPSVSLLSNFLFLKNVFICIPTEISVSRVTHAMPGGRGILSYFYSTVIKLHKNSSWFFVI